MTEVPEKYLEQARDDMVEEVTDDLCSGSPDNAYQEDLWTVVESILLTADKQARMDAIEDLTIMDLIAKVAEVRADRAMDNGDLYEAAMELAVGDAEDRSDYFRDR